MHHDGLLHVSNLVLADGVFAYARHPNFFAEQSFWVAVCFFASASVDRWAGWWCIGAPGLIALFHGSTDFTEKISLGKYPEYAAYRRQVGLVPRLEFNH